MTLSELALIVVKSAEASGVPFMAVGALAAGVYGVPRSTRDVDLLVAVNIGGGIDAVVKEMSPMVEFDSQMLFDTLTWGKRLVGNSKTSPPYKVELFEMFDDPFVQQEFSRRRQVFVPLLNYATWIPTAEDVIVQKLRWGRNKDIDDARDVLAVQGFENLDMNYIETWCAKHGTSERLRSVLASIPPM